MGPDELRLCPAAAADPWPRAYRANRPILHAIATVLLGAQLAGCAGQEVAATATVIDSAGVAIIRNSRLAARVDTIREPEFRIGDLNATGAAEYAFEYVSDVDLLPDDRIVVIDNRGARVAVYDSTGRWMSDLGRQGEGPGEYRMPISAHWRGDSLFIWDVGLGRFTVWLRGDSAIGMSTLASPARPSRLALFGDGVLIERETGQTVDPAPATGWLEAVSLDDTTARTLIGPYPVPEYGWTMNEATGIGTMVNPPVFAARPRWDVSGSLLAWTSGRDSRIELRDTRGALRRIMESARPARPVTEADRDAYFGALQQRFGMPDEVVERERASAELAASLPVYIDLVFDDEGRVWAGLHDPRSFEGTGTIWDVFDDEGRHVRTVVFADRLAVRRIRNGRAYGVATTEDGVHTVDVYTIGDESRRTPE